MPFWSVVRSLPMKERFAASQLELRGFETFLPLVATKRASQPLFNSYFFVRIVEQWRAISTCFGVLCLVRVGDCPSRMPDAEIEALKSMVVGGFVRLPEAPGPSVKRTIAIGARVRITSGPFGGMSGLYAGQSTRERELVLLNLLGGQRSVAIAANLVVPLSEGARR
jgi:transcriptional antiterminator RfaH